MSPSKRTIKKILTLRNIGLLQDATAAGAVDLGSVTAIYADNGRGKSTFATVMRACQLGDAGRLEARKTIDAMNPPGVDFLLHTGAHIEFKDNNWTGALPDIVVFDSEFVEQNVYSGFEVRADQRQALLEFAIGDQTVQLKQQVDHLTQDIETQTRKRTLTEKGLAGYAPPYSVADFIALPPTPNAQSQIDALQKRIEAAKNAQQLTVRRDPTELKQIQFEVQAAFDLLAKQLQDVEETAEVVVRAHLVKHSAEDLEDWISRGQEYLERGQCPFCGQDLGGLELIRAYRSHFNKAYGDLKRDVIALEDNIAAGLAEAKADAIVFSIATNTARIEAWKDQFEVTAPSLDEHSLRLALRELRDHLVALVTAKRQRPLEPVGTRVECEAATAKLAAVNQAILHYGDEVRAIGAVISDFKAKLRAEDIGQLQAAIRNLEATLNRQRPEVVALVNDYQAAEAERRRLEREKAQTRQRIDNLMQTTLQQYEASINQLLTQFGAEFAIEKLKPSYVGSGEPRTEYAVTLRNRSVKLGSRADVTTGPSFGTALSEADKRTLAFAFFVARLRADPNLAMRIVVLDDPVSSLDRNRRHQSVRLIAELATACKQVIVLSHDAYFLRALRERLAELKPSPLALTILTIKRVQNGYSAFDECDIDDICSSDYYRHHRMVADYVDGKATANSRDVAKALRPLLEGYYHRRFPGTIPRKLLFGHIIAIVVDPQTTGPLINLRPLAAELAEVNDYASQFHHDTNPNSDSASIVDAELLLFARRALNLIYQNG